MTNNPRGIAPKRGPYLRKNGSRNNGGEGLTQTSLSGAKQIYIRGDESIAARDAGESNLVRKTNKVSDVEVPETKPPPIPRPQSDGDLADHFLNCAKLGRYLTVGDNSRFVITDDFRNGRIIPPASAMAAIYSKDHLVAQAALLPLSESAHRLSLNDRERFERLFSLIEEQTFSDDVRSLAQVVRNAHFREAEIRALDAALGEQMSPARLRYREFLEIIKKLMDKKITAGPFLDEFRGFTEQVAGKLDFGIYSFCLDRLFGSVRVPVKVKKLLVLELINYPPLIRRELITNILVYRGQIKELIEFVRYVITKELGRGAMIEIELLEAFKLRQLSMSQIETRLARASGNVR